MPPLCDSLLLEGEEETAAARTRRCLHDCGGDNVEDGRLDIWGEGAGQCARISGWRDIQSRRGRRNEGLDPPSFVMACSFFTRYLERAVEKGLLRLSLRRNLLRAEIDFLHLPLVVVVCKMKLDE
jgi:hypothetical protein